MVNGSSQGDDFIERQKWLFAWFLNRSIRVIMIQRVFFDQIPTQQVSFGFVLSLKDIGC
jgi:hypothetical protein